MSEDQDHWIRQEREIRSYNTFFASLSARSDPCLAALGFEAPIAFPRIKGEREGVVAHPDFLLYDGSVLLLVEIKQGNNIEGRHIEQIRGCNRVTIERAQDYLKDAQIHKKTTYSGNVDQVETCIVYTGFDESYVENCRDKWESCREKLEELEKETVVLTQACGEKLRILAGQFDSKKLTSTFRNGVELPENPKKEFIITESWEKEALAVGICHTWGHKAASGPTRVTASEIRSHFAPRHAIPMGRIKRVLTYLDEIDACDKIEDENERNCYEFSVNHMEEILNIEQSVRKQSVEDYLTDEDQTGLDSFMDTDKDSQ